MGVVPIKCKSFRESPRILGIANAFSGGLFLAIALVHIMPEQSESYADADINESLKEYPLPYLLLVAGYTFMLVIDKVLFDSSNILEGKGPQGEKSGNARSSSVSVSLRESVHQMMELNPGADTEKMFDDALRDSMSKMTKKTEIFAARVSIASRSKNEQPVDNQQFSDTLCCELCVDQKDDDIISNKDAMGEGGGPELFLDGNEIDLEASKSHEKLLSSRIEEPKTDYKPSWVENITPFILLIGLGVHSTFEGLALGMSNDFNSTFMFAAAIVLHKWAAGMSLGISMGRTFPGKDAFVIKFIALFALFTPLGVALGWVI